jgi:molybdenum cofactor guanylyltransferase
VALPVVHSFQEPLAAAFRTALAPTFAAVVAGDRLRPAFLFHECRVLRLDEASLLDDRGSWRSTQRSTRSSTSTTCRTTTGPGASRHGRSPCVVSAHSPATGAGQQTVRAATLARLAELVAVSLDHSVLVTVNGRSAERDAQFALTSGDTVVLTTVDER